MTRIDKHDLDKRLSVEREIEKYLELVPQINAQFDETNSYLLYSSLIGIKVIELNSGNVTFLNEIDCKDHRKEGKH